MAMEADVICKGIALCIWPIVEEYMAQFTPYGR